MIGRSLLDQGMFDDAAEEFRTALGLPGLDPAVSANLRYQLGLAHEAAGRAQEALGEFERVYAQQPSYPDVAQKIRVLHQGRVIADGAPEEIRGLAEVKRVYFGEGAIRIRRSGGSCRVRSRGGSSRLSHG